MFEVRNAGVKGLGVFATSLIPRGTRIFSERPLLGIRYDQSSGDVYPAFRSLSVNDRGKLLSLSGHRTRNIGALRWSYVVWYTLLEGWQNLVGRKGWIRPTRRSLVEHNTLLNIFRTNNFALNAGSKMSQAIFPRIARLNHSCVPNVQGGFNDEVGKLHVHALRDINAGTELTLSYLDDGGMLRAERAEKLETYGFDCGCAICNGETVLGQESEARREKIRQTISTYAQEQGVEGGERGQTKELGAIMEVIRLMREEGFVGREVTGMYFEAARLNGAMGEKEEALRCAEEGLKMDERCLGNDHKMYRESLVKVEEYRKALEATYGSVDVNNRERV